MLHKDIVYIDVKMALNACFFPVKHIYLTVCYMFVVKHPRIGHVDTYFVSFHVQGIALNVSGLKNNSDSLKYSKTF